MPNIQKVRKVPLRKCVITNEQHPKMEMFRVVRTPEGEVYVDLKGKMNGRGAYISKNKKAIEIAKKKKILNIKLEVKVTDEIYEQLLSLIGE